MMTDPGVMFAVTLAALYAAHSVADHWVQTHNQALAKSGPGWSAWLADARHVLTLTATLALTLAVVAWRCHLTYDTPRAAVALLVNAVSHYIADRRRPLLRFAVTLGKNAWLENDPQAAYKLDQSWHLGFLLLTALIIA